MCSRCFNLCWPLTLLFHLLLMFPRIRVFLDWFRVCIKTNIKVSCWSQHIVWTAMGVAIQIVDSPHLHDYLTHWQWYDPRGWFREWMCSEIDSISVLITLQRTLISTLYSSSSHLPFLYSSEWQSPCSSIISLCNTVWSERKHGDWRDGKYLPFPSPPSLPRSHFSPPPDSRRLSFLSICHTYTVHCTSSERGNWCHHFVRISCCVVRSTIPSGNDPCSWSEEDSGRKCAQMCRC